MQYDYRVELEKLLTVDGLTLVLDVYAAAVEMLRVSGAFTSMQMLRASRGQHWDVFAALDFLVEKGKLRRLAQPGVVSQDQVYTAGSIRVPLK